MQCAYQITAQGSVSNVGWTATVEIRTNSVASLTAKTNGMMALHALLLWTTMPANQSSAAFSLDTAGAAKVMVIAAQTSFVMLEEDSAKPSGMMAMHA